MKKLIYRIEDDEGIGFYNSKLIGWQIREVLHMNKSRHVPPYEDAGINRSSFKDEKHGFLNEAQLYSWIDKSKIRLLERKGLKLKRIFVEVVAIGEHQVLYREAIQRTNNEQKN